MFASSSATARSLNRQLFAITLAIRSLLDDNMPVLLHLQLVGLPLHGTENATNNKKQKNAGLKYLHNMFFSFKLLGYGL